MTEILQNVDSSKKEKFNQKYKRLKEEDDWTRDNFESKIAEVNNAVENIEDFITGLQDEIDEMRGDKPGSESDFEMIKEDWNSKSNASFDQLEKQTMAAGFNPTLKKLKDKQEELSSKLQKINEWKTLQMELSRLGMVKLNQICSGYRQEYVNSDVAKNFENHAEQIIESKMREKEQEIRRDFEREVADLEQAVNAARNETKNAWKFMQALGEDLGNDRLVQIPEEALSEGLDQFAAGDGTVDLSGEAQRVDDKKSSRDEAREAAVSGFGEDDEETEDEVDEVEEQSGEDLTAREELLEHWDDYYSLLDKQSEIAEELGVKDARVSQLMNEEGLSL